jgi:hypothetical protein
MNQALDIITTLNNIVSGATTETPQNVAKMALQAIHGINAMNMVLELQTIYHLSLGISPLGNKQLTVKNLKTGKSFKVQTNGDLPQTHRMDKDNIEFMVALNEVDELIDLYGTSAQREIMKDVI